MSDTVGQAVTKVFAFSIDDVAALSTVPVYLPVPVADTLMNFPT